MLLGYCHLHACSFSQRERLVIQDFLCKIQADFSSANTNHSALVIISTNLPRIDIRLTGL